MPAAIKQGSCPRWTRLWRTTQPVSWGLSRCQGDQKQRAPGTVRGPPWKPRLRWWGGGASPWSGSPWLDAGSASARLREEQPHVDKRALRALSVLRPSGSGSHFPHCCAGHLASPWPAGIPVPGSRPCLQGRLSATLGDRRRFASRWGRCQDRKSEVELQGEGPGEGGIPR